MLLLIDRRFRRQRTHCALSLCQACFLFQFLQRGWLVGWLVVFVLTSLLLSAHKKPHQSERWFPFPFSEGQLRCAMLKPRIRTCLT